MPVFERVSAELPVQLKYTNYSLVDVDSGTEIQFLTASTLDANLPAVTVVENGYNVILRNIGTDTLIVRPVEGQQIDGEGSLSLGPDAWHWIRNDGTTWKTIASDLGTVGDVDGPASATDNAVARFDGTSGKLIQNSSVIIDDSGNISTPGGLTATGNIGAGNFSGSSSGTNTGDQTIQLTGDVTGMGTGTFATTIADNAVTTVKIADGNVTTAKIADDAVTFAKMQNIASDRLIGRDTALSGAPEEISVTGGLEFTGSGGIQRSALTGDVTASAGSNTTSIAANAVTTTKIADANVTTAKLADGAVTTVKIADANVTAAKLATDSVITTKILDANVTLAKLENAAKAYDFSFVAGFDSTMQLENIAAQNYGELVIARDLTIEGSVGYIDNASSGTDVVLDVLKNGVTIYQITPSVSKPTFTASTGSYSAGTLATTNLTSGDRLTFSVIQPGSTPGKGVRFTLKTRLGS